MGLRRAGVHRVVRPLVHHPRRAGLLAVQRVRDRRLGRFVVGGQRPVDQPGRHVQPALAVALHDERVVAGQRGRPAGARRRAIVRRLGLLEVGHVVAGPLAGLGVPPDVGLALAPRPSLGVGGRAVVEHASVGRPRPAPLAGHPALLAAGFATGRLVHPIGEHAAVDPTAARRGAVVLQLGVARQRPAGRHLETADLPQHGRGARLVVAAGHRVVPGQLEHRAVPWQGRGGQPLPDDLAQMVEEPQVGAALAGRLQGLLPPLQHPLGLGEGAIFLHMRGRRQEEHLGAALGGHDLAGGHLGRVLPEGRALNKEQVTHHQPVEVGHAQPLRPAMRRADRRVLPDQEVALYLAVDHVQHLPVRAVVAGHPRQVAVAVVVLRGGCVAPVRLEQAHGVRFRIAPEPLLPWMADAVDPLPEGLVLGVEGHRQVARQQVEQRGDVGRALDVGVPPHRHDAATGPADVAEQELDDRAGADVLDPDAVLGPAHRIDQRGGAFAAGVVRPRPADLLEPLPRHPTDP